LLIKENDHILHRAQDFDLDPGWPVGFAEANECTQYICVLQVMGVADQNAGRWVKGSVLMLAPSFRRYSIHAPVILCVYVGQRHGYGQLVMR
jgi:hypothetical protein